jgi:hypothetical protein
VPETPESGSIKSRDVWSTSPTFLRVHTLRSTTGTEFRTVEFKRGKVNASGDDDSWNVGATSSA